MPTEPSKNGNQTESKAPEKNTQINPFATVFNVQNPLSNQTSRFANAINAGSIYVRNTVGTDRLAVRKKLFGMTGSTNKYELQDIEAEEKAIRKAEQKKCDEVNRIIADTQKRQINYVMNEVAKRSGANPNEVAHVIAAHKDDFTIGRPPQGAEWTQESFRENLREMRKLRYKVVTRYYTPDGKLLKVPEETVYDEKGNQISTEKISTSYTDHYERPIEDPYAKEADVADNSGDLSLDLRARRDQFDTVKKIEITGKDGKPRTVVLRETVGADGYKFNTEKSEEKTVWIPLPKQEGEEPEPEPKEAEEAEAQSAEGETKEKKEPVKPRGIEKKFREYSVSYVEVLNERGENLVISESEVGEIVKESAQIGNIGPSDEKNLDMLEYDIGGGRDWAMQAYEDSLVKSVLQKTGFTEQELSKAFGHCIKEKPGEAPTIDYDALKKARMDFISQKMSARPEEERTEAAFISDCEKLDVAMSAAVFGKNGITPDRNKVFCNMSSEEYYQFALENIPPKTAARTIEKKFRDYFNSEEFNNERKKHPQVVRLRAAQYIKHLETIHKKRPFFTRVADYFKRDGEDSTIKRMKNMFLGGFSKQQLEDSLKFNGEYFDKFPRLEVRFSDLDTDTVPIPENVEEELKTFDEKYDDLRKQNAEMKDTIPQTINGKERDKVTEVEISGPINVNQADKTKEKDSLSNEKA